MFADVVLGLTVAAVVLFYVVIGVWLLLAWRLRGRR